MKCDTYFGISQTLHLLDYAEAALAKDGYGLIAFLSAHLLLSNIDSQYTHHCRATEGCIRQNSMSLRDD